MVTRKQENRKTEKQLTIKWMVTRKQENKKTGKNEKHSTTIGIEWMVTTATNVCQRRRQDAICVRCCCLPLSIDRKTTNYAECWCTLNQLDLRHICHSLCFSTNSIKLEQQSKKEIKKQRFGYFSWTPLKSGSQRARHVHGNSWECPKWSIWLGS